MKNFAFYLSILSFMMTAFLSASELNKGCDCNDCTCTEEAHCGCFSGKDCQTSDICQCQAGCGCKKHRG